MIGFPWLLLFTGLLLLLTLLFGLARLLFGLAWLLLTGLAWLLSTGLRWLLSTVVLWLSVVCADPPPMFTPLLPLMMLVVVIVGAGTWIWFAISVDALKPTAAVSVKDLKPLAAMPPLQRSPGQPRQALAHVRQLSASQYRWWPSCRRR